jgi:hypothetical protein
MVKHLIARRILHVDMTSIDPAKKIKLLSMVY